MRSSLALALFLMLAPPLLSAEEKKNPPAPPRIQFVLPMIAAPAPQPVPQIVPVGSVLEIQIEGMTADTAKRVDLTFYPRPAGIRVKPVTDWANAQYRVDFSAPLAGKYLVKIHSPPVDANGPVLGAEIEVTVGGPQPDPQPGPGPQPGPQPNPTPPIPKKLQVVVWYETAALTPEWASVFHAKKVRDYLSQNGHSFRPTDKDNRDKAGNVPRELAPSLDRWVASAGRLLPYILLSSPDGQTIYAEGVCPNTPDGLVEWIKGHGG